MRRTARAPARRALGQPDAGGGTVPRCRWFRPEPELTDRIKQLDLNVGKSFDVGRGVRLLPELTVFNAFNNLAVYNVRSLSYDTSSSYQLSTILQPRILRLGLQVNGRSSDIWRSL